MALQQATRSVRIATPLGEDAVQLVGFAGHEEMSRLFEFHLDLISENNSIDPKDLVGQNVTFSIDYADDDSQRWFNGFVQRFVAGDENVKGIRSYRAVVVPWLWFLTQTTDCRIFQEMTIVEIIEKIFQDLGFTDFDTSGIQGTHPTREYCVQYRESDFEFVSRLMEEEGVFYFFEHKDGQHKMVMADSSSGYVDCKESNVDYPVDSARHRVVTPHISSWEHQYEFRSGAVAHTDYNFKTPSAAMMATEKTLMSFRDVKSYERYDYPGEYPEKGIGTPLARLRMEELEVDHDLVHGSSGCKSFVPGGRFMVGSHPSQSEEGKKYIIKSVTHSVTGMSYGSAGGVSEGELEYSNQFTCFPDSATFRPARSTPKPIVQGCQTAVVTGPAGEEIYVDEFGRVKVHFHWDRENPPADETSCWIRVSQVHAGKNFGGIDIPRIGEEVIVSFLEGDPDQPLITGRVYHAENPVPWELPANKTQSGYQSRSTQGGSVDNANIIRFEDKIGEEEMYIHAEKDQNIVVENDRGEDIGRDRSLHVGRDKSEVVDRNKTIKVTGYHEEEIFENMTINVAKNLTETIALSYMETVGGAMQLTVGAALSLAVGGAMSEAVGANKSEQIGNSKDVTVGNNASAQVGKNDSLRVGSNQTIEVGKDRKEDVGGESQVTVKKDFMLKADKISMIAEKEISFKTGKAEIVMKKNGDITIKGKKITVKGSGDVVIKGSKISEN